jgi:outer membrane receptor protein involved in Fe transport
MNRKARLISLFAILTLVSVWAFGQAESGAINGIVTDKTGAVVVGATVTATSVDTGLVRTTTTKSAGEYAITNLPPKLYTITIDAEGFQKYAYQIKVGVGSMNDVSAKLAVSGASTTVEVTESAGTAVVNAENQTLSQTINSKQMVDLPTLTRNPYDLVATAGNVTEDNNSDRGAGYAINGARSADTDILLDGGENVDLFTATVGQSVPLDTVQEFSVLTNNFTAEYGRAGGGVVNVATKSGSNDFHGSLYEFNRLSALAANTYNNDANDIAKPGFTRNQFGYSIGGPIVKNKLFFFSGTEWTRVRSSATVTQSILDPAFLTQPEVNGNTKAFFTDFGSHLRPDLAVLQNINWQQANGGSCPAPLPCNAPFGQYVQYTIPSDSGGGSPQNTYSTVNRIDWNISDKSTLYGRYALYSEDDFAGTINASPYLGYDTGQRLFNQNVTINFTHVFTPNFVSSSKVTYNRLSALQPLGLNPVGPTLYTSVTALPALPGTNGSLVFPGYSETTPGATIPLGGPQNLYQFYEDVSWTKGKHQFKFGGDYIQTRDNRVFGAFENANESLSSGGSISEAAANLVAGQLFQFQGASYPQGKFPCSKDASGNTIVTPECTLTLPVGPPVFGRNNRYNDGAWYVQDSWKVNPRLTLNLGLRWEYYGVQHNANPSLDSNFYLGSGANIYQQVRTGTVQIANQSPVGGLWAKDTNNYAPRVGFAWDVFGDGSTSLRGGYGMGYERNFGNVTFNVIQNPPNYAVVSLVAGSDVPVLPIFTDNSGPLAGTGTKALPGTSLRAVQQNLPTAYTQFWSASIDRQIMRNSVLSLEYSGSKGTGLYDIANLNDPGYGSAFLGDARAANRINYQYTNINYRGGNGFSNYNGINVKFSGNNIFNKGLQLLANYTWSHAIDNLSDTFSGGYSSQYVLGYTNPYAPGLDKGNADFDTRHRFVVSGVWDLPWMKNASNAFARQALGGWSLSPVFKVHSGYPFSIYDCTNLTGSSGSTCPRYAPGAPIASSGHADAGNPIPGSPNLFTYLQLPLDASGLPAGNGNVLAVPVCSGLYGVGCVYTKNGQSLPQRNSYQSPGFWNIDFVAMKNFKLTERFTMQFRGEFYNIFNHHNMYIQATNLDIENGTGVTAINTINGSPSAGSANSILPDERRNIQFALKLLF